MCIAPLEIHFPKIGAESILENITLAGGLESIKIRVQRCRIRLAGLGKPLVIQ